MLFPTSAKLRIHDSAEGTRGGELRNETAKMLQGVDYGRLTALLIEATKEQQKLIERQQQQISLQHAETAHLRSQVKTVQAALKTNSRKAPEVQSAKANLAHQ